MERLTDVGVAGIHRVLSQRDVLQRAARDHRRRGDGRRAAVGRRGPCCVPGDRGSDERRLRRDLRGIAALLTMLNSCAAGVTVVNIDNGFGAAMAAARVVSA